MKWENSRNENQGATAWNAAVVLSFLGPLFLAAVLPIPAKAGMAMGTPVDPVFRMTIREAREHPAEWVSSLRTILETFRRATSFTAVNGGGSPEARFLLRDMDGNVLSSAALGQAVGEKLITLSDGRTVARLGPGDWWESAPVAVPVPLTAPDGVRLALVVDAVRHRTGTAEQVVMEGFTGTRDVVLAETTYQGEVTSVVPGESWGEEPIVIQVMSSHRV